MRSVAAMNEHEVSLATSQPRSRRSPRRAGQSPRVVVITGASAGIGRAAARAFARDGAHVGLIARGVDGLEAARSEIDALGGRAIVIPTDVADANAVERAAALVEDSLGPIDVWVNNAMVSVFSPAVEMTTDEYMRVTDVTYLGYVWGTLAALRRMRARNRGVIIQVGSALAYRSIPLQSAYCAAKHAIEGFTESLRSELLHENSRIRITSVHMPAVNTPQFDWVRSRLPRRAQPVPPIFQPEIAARAIVWAAHHRRRELWVGWPTVKAVIGDKLIPGLLDRYLARVGFDAQQTDEAASPGHKDNLWAPLPGDHGAHGRFDGRSRSTSLQLWASMRRRTIAAGALGFAAVAVLLARAAVRSFTWR